MSLYEILSLTLEASVVIILVVEYRYDKHLNEHVKALKRRTKRSYEFQELNQGEHK